MSQISHGFLPKRTLGALEKQLMCVHSLQDELDMTKVIRPGRVVDQDIIKEHKHKPAKIGTKDVVHECLERVLGTLLGH